ncbi:MAG: phosphoribosyltransferase family protein [Candidatus Thorarchaeota archaeon]
MSIDFVLASGAEHLKKGLQEREFQVFLSDTNYDKRRFFPNTDLYVRISDISKLSRRRVIVVQSCTGSSPDENEKFSTADRIQELILILKILRNPVHVKKIAHKQYEYTTLEPPSRIEVVLTLQPYALQDKPFKTGETASSYHATQAIADICDKLWLVSPIVAKDTEWAAKMYEKGQYTDIDITQNLIRYGAERFGFDDYVLVAPDEGAQKRFGIPGLRKQRSDSYAIMLSGEVDIDGKNVIIIDDMTKSGTTLLKSREILLKQGAKDVGLAVLHVTPIKDSGEVILEKLVEESGGKIVTSNTVFTSTFCNNHPELLYDITDDLVSELL